MTEISHHVVSLSSTQPSSHEAASARFGGDGRRLLRKKNTFRGLVGILAAFMGCWTVPGVAVGQDLSTSDSVAVRYAQARRAVVDDRLKVMGTVVASRSTVVASEVAGAVESLSVRPGQKAKKGQEIARLRTRPLELRLAAARGELGEAEARRSSSFLRLERLQTLADSEVVSPQHVDDASYELQAWEGRVARLSAEVERLQDELEHGVLRAPFDGTVVVERTQVGQWLNVGDPVVEMVSLDGLEARLEVPESRFPQIVPGLIASISVEGGSSEAVQGKVRAVVPKAAELAHTFPVYISLPADSGLAIGMLVRAELSMGAGQDAVWVPKDALVQEGERWSVFVMSPDQFARRVAVRVGRAHGLWREVAGEPGGQAVEAGDHVITHGNEDLGDGQSVRAVPQEYPVR